MLTKDGLIYNAEQYMRKEDERECMNGLKN
jgi:hypothetical protein